MTAAPSDEPVVLFGDRAVLVRCGTVERAWALDARLGSLGDRVQEAVPGWGTVLVHVPPPVDPRSLLAPLTALLSSLDRSLDEVEAGAPEARVHRIDVVYDGPDLDDVAAETGLRRDEVIGAHLAGAYRVAFVGFSPGFPYLAGLDARLGIPRRAVPRPSVPAGSVAIGGGQAGVYPSTAPGGWHLLGRTDAVLFDPTRPDPAVLRAGDHVRFVAVDALGVSGDGRRPAGRAASEGPSTHAARVRAGGATVQGAPRLGLGRSGLPAAGPVDPWSAAVARRLLGADDGAPLLEVGPLGLELDVLAPLTVVVPRGTAVLEVDGRVVAEGAPVAVEVGSVVRVRVGRRRSGVLAIAGLTVDPAFGSSHDVLSGLGPAPLRAGDGLRVLATAPPAPGSAPGPASLLVQRTDPPDVLEPGLPIRCVIGPHAVADDPTLEALLAREWLVSSTSNRVGTRLEGRPLPEPPVGSVASLGMVQGAVQVPSGGLPVVLGPDHGTTGGYPVVAVVIEADRSRIAVLPAGAPVRFCLVDTDEARRAAAERARSLATAVADLSAL